MSQFKHTESKEEFCLVNESLLPEVYRKVLKVKEILDHGPTTSVNQACKDCELSRSAYYKYRDAICAYGGSSYDASLLLQIVCEQKQRTLPRLILRLDEMGIALHQISQSVSVNGLIGVQLLLDLSQYKGTQNEILLAAKSLPGIREITAVDLS